ncbi:DUF998 domain-containing protein, partial [Dysosmobacter welbionis]
HDAEVDIHGLEHRDGGIGHIQPQSADGGLPGEIDGRPAGQAPSGLHPHQKAGGGGLHISLHAGHLAGKGEPGLRFQPVVPVQQPGRVQKGIPVHDAVAQKLCVVEGGDHGEHPPLLREFQVGLEAHQVVHRAVGVVSPQLHHGVGLLSRAGILQPPGLQGAVAEGIVAPAGHDLHGHTALKYHLVLKAVDRGLLGRGQLLPEGVVLLLGHGAVDI